MPRRIWREFSFTENTSLKNDPSINPTFISFTSDNPSPQTNFQSAKQALWRMLRLTVRACILLHRIIRVLWYVYPTQVIQIIRPYWNFMFLCCTCPTRRSGHLDTPNIFYLCCFTVTWYLCGGLDASSRRRIGHLVSTVHWTPRLDGTLDISSRRCNGRLGYGLDVIQRT